MRSTGRVEDVRTQSCRPAHLGLVRMNGDVAHIFLTDGVVAGTWRVENGRVFLEPFSTLPRSVQRELDGAERLERLLAN